MKKTLLSLSLVAVMAAFSSCGCDAGTENNSEADATAVTTEQTEDAAKCGEGKCGEGKCGEGKTEEVKKSKEAVS